MQSFPELSQMSVLDLGGTPQFWRCAPVRPHRVTTVNLAACAADEPWIHHVQADACTLPDVLTAQAFDLVVSNSLLEHVGGHARRKDLAETIRQLSDSHWVQTPYRYFPIEPHWLFPGLQFLPFEARVRATQHWPLGSRHLGDRSCAIESVHEVELIGLTQMRSYFPQSTIWRERMMGLTKSIVAVATDAPSPA